MNIYWLEQTEADVPTETQWLSAYETLRLGGMRIPKRRADWRLGRWTAEHALAACLNLPTDFPSLASMEIPAAPSATPDVFLNDQARAVAITLSHRTGMGLRAAAPVGPSIGYYLEPI